MKSILVLGLNPAWQRTLEFERFQPGEVNRAKAVSSCPAGKGVNFARAAKIWGKADCVVAQFAGGLPGQRLLEGLDDEGIRHLTRKVDCQTRTCTTVLSSAAPRMTELIEPSAPIQPDDAAALLKEALSLLPDAAALAICGTYPPGIAEDFYGSLAAKAAGLRKPVLVDSVMATEKVLPHLKDGILKLNLSELKSISKEHDVKGALRKCRTSYGIAYVAATDGPHKAFFADDSGVWSYELPRLDAVENPLGAGDTCSAVTLSELLAGTPPQEAFAFGLAAASASCLDRRCAFYSKDKALEIRTRTHVNFDLWM